MRAFIGMSACALWASVFVLCNSKIDEESNINLNFFEQDSIKHPILIELTLNQIIILAPSKEKELVTPEFKKFSTNFVIVAFKQQLDLASFLYLPDPYPYGYIQAP